MTETTDTADTTNTVGASRRVALRSLALIIGAAALGWVLFIIGQYAELVRTAGTSGLYYDSEQANYTQFFMVAAIAVFGIGALIAKRQLAVVRADHAARSALVESVSQLASIVMIVSAVFAALSVFTTFMSGFMGSDAEPAPLARLVNVYVPIILYTALVVTLILTGFVFGRPATQIQQAPVAVTGDAVPAVNQRAVAFAFATPIIAAAVALVLGLIVYDLTRTALQVWIWVVIVSIVGAGVVAGAILARRAHVAGTAEAPVVGGAKVLNFVLSIVFAVVICSMSLGYGSSAVYQLNVWPDLSLSAYGDNESYEGDNQVTILNPTPSLWGSDMQRGSEVVVTLTPGDEKVKAFKVSSDGYVGEDFAWPSDLATGSYSFVATGVAGDGTSVEILLPFVIEDATSKSVVFPEGSVGSYYVEQGQLQPVTAGWFFGDLLPAGVLLLLGLGVLSATILVNSRDY